MEEELANWTPLDGLDVDCVNILLIGQVGNGKSSFINTINSVFRGYVNPKAVTGNADHSLTTKVNEILLHCGGCSLGPKRNYVSRLRYFKKWCGGAGVFFFFF